MTDSAASPTWGSQRMDEFVAWLSRPGSPGGAGGPVSAQETIRHIDNVKKYIGVVEKLAKLGNEDAAQMMVGLSPVKRLLDAAQTGAELAEAATAASGYLDTFMAQMRREAGDKAVRGAGYATNDTSWQADDQRTIGEASAERLRQFHSRRVIAYDNPDGTSIPQLFACKKEQDFVHKLMFWKKTAGLGYAPCDSIHYLLKISR